MSDSTQQYISKQDIQQQIQKLQEKKTTKAHLQIRRLRAQLKREEK